MLFMAANVSCLSVYTLHTHITGWGELHFILQGWKALPTESSAWGGWGICSTMRNWEENCSLHLQGLLGEENFTWIHFFFHLHIILTTFFALSLSACTFISLPWWSSLHFCNSAGVKNAFSATTHCISCEAQRSWTNSASNTCSCRGCFSVVNLSHAHQVCVQPHRLAAAYWEEEGCPPCKAWPVLCHFSLLRLLIPSLSTSCAVA